MEEYGSGNAEAGKRGSKGQVDGGQRQSWQIEAVEGEKKGRQGSRQRKSSAIKELCDVL
jgi:hypothetical protein